MEDNIMEEINPAVLNPEDDLVEATPQEIPEPTFWPIVLGFAVMFFFWGMITSLIITGVGVLMIAIAITGWITELNNE